MCNPAKKKKKKLEQRWLTRFNDKHDVRIEYRFR